MGLIYQRITCPTTSGDYNQTNQVSHGCFLRHSSKGQQLPWARISGVNPTRTNVCTYVSR